MLDLSDLLWKAFLPLMMIIVAYGVMFYVVYLFYKQLRGIRRALDRIADRNTL